MNGILISYMQWWLKAIVEERKHNHAFEIVESSIIKHWLGYHQRSHGRNFNFDQTNSCLGLESFYRRSSLNRVGFNKKVEN